MSQSLYRYLKDIFKAPNQSTVQILKLIEPRYDKEYTYYSFLIHFFVYLLLVIPGLDQIRIQILPILLCVSIARLILLLQYYTKTISLPFMIYSSGIIADGLLYSVFIIGMIETPSVENFFIFSTIQIVLILSILLYSVRLDSKACFYSAGYFTILHLIYLRFVPDLILDSVSNFTKYFPIGIFFGSATIGTIFVLNKRKDTAELYNLSEEKRYIQQELELAKKVQDALFPSNEKIFGIEYTFYRKNPNLIGGDFFDFVQLREGNVGVFLTDVAGHGISSAMVASIVKVLVSTLPYRFKTSPAKLMSYLDDRLVKDLNKYHASAIYLFFDFVEKKCILGNAGHPYLIMAKKNGPFEEVVTEGPILGFNIKIPPVVEKEIQIESGDRFFIYTDGLIETLDKDGVSLESEGLLEILNKHSDVKNLKELEAKILLELRDRFGIDTFSDDTMFLIIEVD
ncbi:MAG: PP2C family protein-serine/threonine phosphatase [Leptospira sp.]|nr:PP2C family protein-serine/threonine phosphatase [Leptospira sp.]